MTEESGKGEQVPTPPSGTSFYSGRTGTATRTASEQTPHPFGDHVDVA